MKQTAIEWLVETITKKHDKHFSTFYGAEIEQANQMFEEQIIDAYEEGEDNIDSDGCQIDKKGSEQYYNETFGGEK
jgi:hypothetical protein